MNTTLFDPEIDVAAAAAKLRDEVARRHLPSARFARLGELCANWQHAHHEKADVRNRSAAAALLATPNAQARRRRGVGASHRQFVFVTPWYGHFAGGAEVAARSFAQQLARRGCDVEVLTTCCRDPYESWWQNTLPPDTEEIEGVTVRRFPVNTEGEATFHALNARHLSGQPLTEDEQRTFVRHTINSDKLVEYAARHTAHKTVIALPYTQGLVHSLLARLAGHACLMSCLHDEPQLVWATTAESLSHARRIFFLTAEEKSLAIRHYGQRLGRALVEAPVVGVGSEIAADIQALLDDPHQIDVRLAAYQLPPRYFVYVGRKDVGKNVPRLVEQFRSYRAQGGQASLVFLGGGVPELVPSESGLRDLGFVPEADKTAIIARAMGLINLSENESFSLAIMEAWLCRVPVIVSSGCETTAAHCHKSGGGIAVDGNAEFVATLRAFESASLRSALGWAGHQYARHHYGWDSVVDRLMRGAA